MCQDTQGTHHVLSKEKRNQKNNPKIHNGLSSQAYNELSEYSELWGEIVVKWRITMFWFPRIGLETDNKKTDRRLKEMYQQAVKLEISGPARDILFISAVKTFFVTNSRALN